MHKESEMIHVAIDTNIYRKKPRLDSPEFKALAFLAKNKCICLHIPFFVEKEFRSQLEIEQKKRLDSVILTLTKIYNFPESGTKTQALRDIITELKDSNDELVQERGEAFIQWASKLNAERYAISTEETNDALSAYFQGLPPFKEPKIRKDIPDSFIFQSLLRINNKTPIHVVVEDGALREACSYAGMNCYVNLGSFIENEKVKELLQGKIDNDILEALESQIVEYLKDNRKHLLSIIEEKLSDECGVISGDYIPGESNEIYVSGVNEPQELIIESSIEYYGDALFAVNFSANVELLYEYAVYKSDAYDLDPKKYFLEYLNDHYFNVETTDEFTFTGRIELEYEIALEEVDSVTELLKILSEPAVTIEEIDVFKINA